MTNILFAAVAGILLAACGSVHAQTPRSGTAPTADAAAASESDARRVVLERLAAEALQRTLGTDEVRTRGLLIVVDFPAGIVRPGMDGDTELVCGEVDLGGDDTGASYGPFYWDSRNDEAIVVGRGNPVLSSKEDIARICNGGKQFASTSGQTEPTTELEIRSAIRRATRSAFMTRKFDELDRMADEYRSTRSRTPSGTWKLTHFYAGIDEVIDLQPYPDSLEGSFDELDLLALAWQDTSPASASARIVVSRLLIKRAWEHRGDGMASSVSADANERFDHFIAAARENLERDKAIASADPQWYAMMFEVARAQGWERAEFDALVEEALAREPLFYENYFFASYYLLPRWHGTAKDLEEFATAAERRTSAVEGGSLYARIYWVAYGMQYRNALFAESMADWPRMRAGFEDIMERYPDPWNLNHFAKFACLAKDQETTRHLLEQIGPNAVIDAWGAPQVLESCMLFAVKTK